VSNIGYSKGERLQEAMMPVAAKRVEEVKKIIETFDCKEVHGAGAPGDIKVWWIQLLKGDAKAIIAAWPEARERIIELLRPRAEKVELRNKTIVVEGVKESVYLDPAAVYWVKVHGRGTYYTVSCRRGGKTVYVHAIYFSPEP